MKPVRPKMSKTVKAVGPSSTSCGSNSSIDPVRKTCKGLSMAMATTPSTARRPRMRAPSRTRSRASTSTSQTMKASVWAVSTERVSAEMKKPRPTKVKIMPSSRPMSKPSSTQGTATPRAMP